MYNEINICNETVPMYFILVIVLCTCTCKYMLFTCTCMRFSQSQKGSLFSAILYRELMSVDTKESLLSLCIIGCK